MGRDGTAGRRPSSPARSRSRPSRPRARPSPTDRSAARHRGAPAWRPAVASSGSAPTRRGPGSGRRVRPDDRALLDRDRPSIRRRRGGWWAAADRAVDEASLAACAGRPGDRERRSTGPHRRRRRCCGRGGVAGGPCGRFTAADDALTAPAGTDAQRAQLADLLVPTGGGGLPDRPRIALTDAVTGALLALTDLPAAPGSHCGAPACRRNPDGCNHDLTGRPGLGPPGPTDGYRPSAPLDRCLRARDRRCRFPGCRRRCHAVANSTTTARTRADRPARRT